MVHGIRSGLALSAIIVVAFANVLIFVHVMAARDAAVNPPTCGELRANCIVER